MTAGDRSHSATETAEAERETHQTEGIGARHWPKLVRAHQSKEPQNQNWIAKASGALSRRLHSSKVLIISVNMVLVIILLLFNAATLYKWPALIETLHQNDPDYTADQIFHTLIPKLAQMETWRDHNAQLKAHTDQIDAQVNGQITLFSIRGEILAQTSLHPDPGSHNDPQTHYISQQSFAAIQPDAQATSHFVSLEQLLSAEIHKTLQNAYRHADFNIRSNIGNLYFLETGIIKHKDKILGALAIFIEDSARQKIYSDLRIQSVAAVGLGILISVLISLLIFYRVSHPITVLTRRLQQKNAHFLTSLSVILQAEGFEVKAFSDGASALDAFSRLKPNLAVIDIKMPRMDGLELLQKLRQKSWLPIIFLTSKDDEIDEILGLRLGADEYVTKPFSERLLIERIRTLLRRHDLIAGKIEPDKSDTNVMKRGNLTMDPQRHTVQWKGIHVALTITEFLLLQALAIRPGFVKSRDQLMDVAYGDQVYVDDRTIDSHVKRLRKKMRVADESFTAIETLYGIGYRYNDTW
jgi:two-component system response regulator ChvI